MPEENKATELFDAIEKADIPVADQVKGALSLLSKNKGTLTDEQKKSIASLSKAEEAEAAEINKEELPAPVRAALEKAEAAAADAVTRATNAENIMKAEAVKVRKAEFVAKAQALPHVPRDGKTVEEFADSLMALADANPDQFAVVEKSMQLTETALAKSAMWSEIGSGAGGVGGDVLAKAEGMATELRKAESGMTKEAAMAQVWEQNPEMYAEYTASRPKAGR